MDAPDTIEALSALAHDTRLAVYRLLETAGEDGLRAGIIASRLNVSPTALSSHLGVLSRAGIVSSQRQGSAIIYRSRPERVRALARLLVEG